jgi:thiamine transporter ThiT
LTFYSNRKIERLDVETSVIENIATGHIYANALDIHYNKGLVYWTEYAKIMRYDIHYNTGFVYWTDYVYDKIIRYDIHYNTGFVYLTDVVDKRIITYFIAHFTFPQEIPLASTMQIQLGPLILYKADIMII